MQPYLRVVGRGFLLVTLVSLNTVHLATGRIGLAMIGGFFISVLWWSNSSKKREDIPGAALAYGFGAACGTGAGFMLARLMA
jgi:hypothetical protein